MKKRDVRGLWILMTLLVFLVLVSIPNLVNSLQNDSNLSPGNKSDRTSLNVTVEFNYTDVSNKSDAVNETISHANETLDINISLENVDNRTLTFGTTVENTESEDSKSVLFKDPESSEIIGEISSNITSNKRMVDVIIKLNRTPVMKIELKGVEFGINASELIRVDDVAEEKVSEMEFVEVYAIDPTQLNFTDAVVTVVAKGNSLYKCKDWNFTEQECYGEWKLFKTGLVPGEEYSFILTPEDAGFGEIIITNAQHLDSDYNFISDIYDEVKDKDGVWSEEINSGEYVRVAYEKNLTNGNIIDVFVRGDGSFEVYIKEDDSNLLGSSGFVDLDGGWKYITLESVNTPTDTFDFKVFGSLEFDYIHDAPPNLSSVILNSTLGTNLTTENLTIYTDQDDNSSLKLIYNWKKDGSSVAVLNMPFEGGSNSTFTKDYSDNANNATGFNGSLWQSDGGYDGFGAYKFDRANDTYFTVPDFNYADDFTVSFWFNATIPSGSLWHYLYSHGTWNSFNNFRVYFAESTGSLITQLRDSDDPVQSLSVSGLNDSNWHFYTFTLDKSLGAKVYIDGTLQKSNASIGLDTFNPATDLIFGGRSDLNTDRHYNGWFDELRVYNSALSLDQIILLNNSQPEKIHSSETSAGDVWQACAIPNDGIEDGNEVCSNNLTISGPSSGSVSVRVSQSSDDAEEAVTGPFTGDVEIDSSDLEMVEDLDFQEGDQTIGLRFQNVDIPNGAVIDNAYIEFEVDETNTVTTNLRIYGEDIDNAPTFTTTDSSITARTKTSAFASWDNIPAWNTVSEKQQTVDISSVVKEIVDRSGWSSGNSMIFIINGTGKRVAEAWDGESANAPLLVVNWTTFSNSAPSITSVILNSTLGTNLTSENLTAYAINVSDPENDSVKVIYNWKKDGTSIAVLNMPMEGGTLAESDTKVKDYSGFGNNGTVNGAVFSSTSGYDGRGAYTFDGNDYVDLINNEVVPTRLQILGNHTNYTVMARIKTSDTSTPSVAAAWVVHHTIISLRDRVSSDRSIPISFGIFNQKISLGRGDEGNATSDFSERASGDTTVTDGNWHHIVAVVMDDDVDFYLDGNLDGQRTYTFAINDTSVGTTSADMQIGVRSRDGGQKDTNFFNGTIDEIRIYDYGLSAEQISALYNNRTDLIVSQETSVGDVWSVEVTPNDGTQDGTSVLSNNLTVLSVDNPPQITQVQPISTITLTSFSITNVNVLFNVTDADGFADLNDSLALCSLSKTGEATRNSTSCTAQNQSGNDLVYSCSLGMQFYDVAGVWNVTCFAEDNGGLSDTNNTETATVNALNYVTQDLSSLNWSSLIPGNNDEEAQAPLILSNGGNQNYSNFNISSQNATSGSDTITNGKFKVDNETNQSSGQTNLNDSGVIWSEGSLPKCNSPCSSNSSEEAYFYVDTPIGILGGVYASIANWTVSLS